MQYYYQLDTTSSIIYMYVYVLVQYMYMYMFITFNQFAFNFWSPNKRRVQIQHILTQNW